jgi:outer membrane protein assembly factor BamB
MNTMSSPQSPATRQRATVVREYGPLPVERVHGVTHDGTRVWFAHGKKVAAMNPETGAIEKEIDVPAEAGTASDGQHLYQIGEDKIRKLDAKTGRVIATLAAPGMTRDNSGLTWDGGTLWVGQYKGRAIHQIDATTGEVLKTLRSDRFVTGVSFVDGELWHGTFEEDTSELRRVDPATGRVLERLDVDGGVSGLEAKGDLLFCGGIKKPVVRAIKRPTRK